MSAPPPTAARLLLSVRLHARLLTLWMGELWRQDRTSPDQGLAITSGEVQRLLGDPSELDAARRAFLAGDPEAARLEPAAAAAARTLAADPAWRRLIGGFSLSEPEADLLALTLGAAWDPGLARVYAYLQDDAQAMQPTALLASRVFRRSPATPRNLLRWRLALPLDGQAPGLPGTAWTVDPAVALSLGAEGWRDPVLGAAVRPASPQEIIGWPVLHPAALTELSTASKAAATPVQLDLCGAEGAGRQTLALRFAEAIDRPLLVVDTARLLADPARKPADLLTAVLRMARFTGAVTFWRDAQLLPAETWKPARDLADLTLCAWPQAGPTGVAGGSRQIVLDAIQTRDRLAVWRCYSDAPPPGLVATQRLNAGEVAEAARASAAGPAAVRAALRRSAPLQDDLLSLVPTPYGWDDLVAPPEMTRQLREFAAQISLRWPVYEDWGYERLTHLGRGLAALFGGPSGVGKTMAAQVIARELDLDLYRVDLAGVINKYIGETEKRLRSVFDYCERAGCILFFDEADALFGSRMQVKDAHDRFANIEIDYLLQRIERFNGVTILATNRKNDLDSAFLRRLRVIIDFMPPGPAERLLLWKKALIPLSPSGERILDPIDWDFLAERLALTGADIKSAALGAAFLAKAEGVRVGMGHVLSAVQREMTKHGMVLRTPLKEALS
jgi:SpoVK/Ycf46/Vps4 family AAA+-type ATPase